jgi:biopolymer transport protein TolR
MARAMAESGAGSGERRGGQVAQINVTPMIDVLLVLLIIFMVIAPVTPRGLSAHLPQPPKPHAPSGPDDAVVVQIASHPGAAPTYRINDTVVAHSAILATLTEIYSRRPDRVLFVEGDGQAEFADVADVIGIGRAAGVDRIGLLTPGSRGRE